MSQAKTACKQDFKPISLKFFGRVEAHTKMGLLWGGGSVLGSFTGVGQGAYEELWGAIQESPSNF